MRAYIAMLGERRCGSTFSDGPLATFSLPARRCAEENGRQRQQQAASCTTEAVGLNFMWFKTIFMWLKTIFMRLVAISQPVSFFNNGAGQI